MELVGPHKFQLYCPLKSIKETQKRYSNFVILNGLYRLHCTTLSQTKSTWTFPKLADIKVQELTILHYTISPHPPCRHYQRAVM